MDRFQTFSVFSFHGTGIIRCGEYLSMAQQISLVMNSPMSSSAPGARQRTATQVTRGIRGSQAA